jgi:hypothetical protein
MGARQVNLLEMVFAGPGGSCCAVVPDERAQACIIDMDSVGAVEEVLRRRRLDPTRPMMLTGVRQPPDSVVGTDLFVQKPIRVDALVEAVVALRSRVRGPIVTAPEDLPPRHRALGSAVGEQPPTIVLPAITLHPVPGRERPWSATSVPVADLAADGPTPPPQDGPKPQEARTSAELRGTSAGEPGEAQGPSGPSSANTSVSGASSANRRPSASGAGPAGSVVQRGAVAPGVPVVVRPRVIRVGSAWQATGEVLPQVEPVTGPDGVRVGRICGYEPARYLQGLVARARQEGLRRNRAVHLEGPWPTITLLPTCGTAVVAGGAQALRPYSPQYDLPSHGRVTFTPAPLFSPNHPDAIDLEALIWELALGACGGRVPEGTQPDALCALRDWPNFTRLAPTPGAMSIAALWTCRVITLEETARTLQIPLKEVCSFYSAAHAVGLITPPTEIAPASPVARSVTPSPRSGLLRRVFEKLRVA